MTKIIKLLWGDPVPEVDLPVGVVYNTDDGIIIVFANSIEEAKAVEISAEIF